MSNDTLDFNNIHDDYRPKIRRYLSRLVGAHEAEDLTQEVFIKISRGLRDFQKRSGLSTWIYKIATNVAVDRLRSPDFQRAAQNKSIDAPSPDDEDLRMIYSGPSPEQHVIRKEMNECIREYINKLPADYRTVLVLSEMEGFKNTEIAEILGTSLDTVKIRLHRARAQIKETLEKQCSFYRDKRNVLSCDRKGPALISFRKK